MEVDKAKDEFVFSSGRRLYANQLIIGINPELELSGGYDESICTEGYWNLKGDLEDADAWTAEEKLELAGYMIGLWQQFAQSA